VHEISLHWVTAESESELICQELIAAHHQFLNPKIVASAQVKRLIERLINHLKENKENQSANKVVHQRQNQINNIKTTQSPIKQKKLTPMLMVLESSPDTDFKTQDEQRKIKPDFAQFLAP
jgi:hypothetical protein